jgi:hypothetical protein
MRKKISIITGAGGHLGSGHLQRMASLVDFIRKETSHEACIVMGDEAGLLPPALRSLCVDSIPQSSALLIRDIRDSTSEEMRALLRIAPVVAIDDCGSGRNLATHAIDLLPNPLDSAPRNDLFLFGHTFTESIRAITKKRIIKTIDVALYCGYRPAQHTIDHLLSLVPRELTCAILAGNDSRFIKRGQAFALTCSCAEALLASRVLISHFGITLYEGHLAGCRIVSINPTPYHARLVDKIGPELNPVNLGIIPVEDPLDAAMIILKAARNPLINSIETAMVLEQINGKLRNFLSKLSEIINS